MSAAFDPVRLELTEPPVQVAEDVRDYSLSRTGMLVYVAGRQPATSLVWVDRSGRAEMLIPSALRLANFPRLARDNRRIVMGIQNGTDRNLWVYDISRDALTKLTFERSNNWPAWSPDGTRVFYGSNVPGTSWDVYWRAADGTGDEIALVAQPGSQVPCAMSPVGDWLAYSETRVDTGEDLWLLPLREQGTSRPFAQTPAEEQQPAFSPDGRWLAYVSNESGRDEVYVRPVTNDAGKWQISADGGSEPLWNPNGREIFFRESEKLYAVDVTIGTGIAAGTPRGLFEGPYPLGDTGSANYDVSADGERFLMVDVGASEGTSLHVVANWGEELRRLVPTD